MLWNEALEGFWLARRQNLSKHTIADYSITFRRFGEWIDHGDVSKVKPKDVRAFLLHLQEDLGLAPKTCSNHWIALSSLWTWLEEDFEMTHIMRKVAKPKYKKKPPDTLSENEIKRLIDACITFRAYDPVHNCYVPGRRPTALRDVAIIVTFVATGIRVGELVDLTVGDYHRKQGKLIVRHGKGDKMRILYVGESATRHLWRYLISRGRGLPPGRPLFESSTGYRMTRSAVQSMISRAGERAGVVSAHPHRFRHTFAINFLRNGGSVLELKELLGHENLETVLIYARLAEVDLEAAQRRSNVADAWKL